MSAESRLQEDTRLHLQAYLFVVSGKLKLYCCWGLRDRWKLSLSLHLRVRPFNKSEELVLTFLFSSNFADLITPESRGNSRWRLHFLAGLC